MMEKEDWLVMAQADAKNINTADDLIELEPMLIKIIFEAALNTKFCEYLGYGNTR